MAKISESVVLATTVEQALKALAGAQHVYVHCRLNGYIPDNPDLIYRDAFGAGLKVTKMHARAFITSAFKYRTKCDTVAALRLSINIESGYPKYNKRSGHYSESKPEKTVWIGG